MAEKGLGKMLEIVGNILRSHTRPGTLEVAVGDERKEAFYLESMEAMVNSVSGRAKVEIEHGPKLEQINDELVKAINSFHNHDVPETLNHLMQARVLVGELRTKLKGLKEAA